MIYGSVCSGIEAATCAWHPLGWQASFLSEIEPFPRAVLKHRWPRIPLHGDFVTIKAGDYAPIDLLVGGTPCQSFSVAGLRGGLHDDRGNLALEYLRLAGRLRPRWLVWENVPGAFSAVSHDAPDFRPPDIDLDSGDGPADGEEVVVEDSYDADETHAFACMLAGFSELGYGWAYRVLDAQFTGVPQRRRRIFLVGYLGDWRRAAAVLFERHSLSGNPAPRREAGKSVAGTISQSLARGGTGQDAAAAAGIIVDGAEISKCLSASHTASGRLDPSAETFVARSLRAQAQPSHRADSDNYVIAHSLRGEGFDASEDGTGRGTPLIPVAYRTSSNCGAWDTGDRVDALTTNTDPNSHVLAFSCKDYGADAGGVSPTLRSMGHDKSHANAGGQLAVAFNLRGREGGAMPEEADAVSLRAASGGSTNSYIAFDSTQITSAANRSNPKLDAPSHPISASAHPPAIAGSAVRRLTPRECERLQGFPDDYTLIPWRNGVSADGPRYKALGNSMAVPVMAWIGRRIGAVEALLEGRETA